MKNTNTTNKTLNVTKNGSNYALRTAEDVYKLHDLMAKYSGKNINLETCSDETFTEIKELVKKLMTVCRFTPAYINAVMWSISGDYDEIWSHTHGSPNSFRENVGAGRASAHYSRYSTTERALNGTLNAEEDSANEFSFFVAPIVKIVKWLKGLSEDLFVDMDSAEANDYVMIWDYAVESSLDLGKATMRLWYDTEYLSERYKFINRDTKDEFCAVEETEKKIPVLTTSMMYSKMMSFARNNNGCVEFPRFTMTDVRALAEIRSTKQDISEGYAEAVLDHYIDFAHPDDVAYYAVNDINDMHERYFDILDKDRDDVDAHRNIVLLREMFDVFESWRNSEFLASMLYAKDLSVERCMAAYRRSIYYTVRHNGSNLKYRQGSLNLAETRTNLVEAK